MIPKILHYVYGLNPDFGGKPFHLVHKIAILSAIEKIKPDKIFLYYSYEPVSEHWEEIKKYVELVKIDPPGEIFNNKIYHCAHKADIIRLSKLNEIGGIYFDIDTLCLNSFDGLLDNKFVMAKQDDRGLCNAIMLAEKNSEFGKIWFDEYKNFNSNDWDYHSVVLPGILAKQYQRFITVLNTDCFFQPNHLSIEYIFDKYVDKSSAYAMHLWESKSWDKYIKYIDENWVRSSLSTYGVYAREFI